MQNPNNDPPKLGHLEDAPVVHWVQQLLEQAVSLRASDLHFEPYEHLYRVRMRIDGELREMASPPMALKDRLASRIKVLSRLDIAEKRVPQDGRMTLLLASGRELDLRVSTLPTLFGEKLVIRILDSAQAQLDLTRLGYEPQDLERLIEAIRRPHGMVLMTGPTGSGKTQSLYACLNLLNTAELNIATVEDPCEIQLHGINQVNVQGKPGLTFAIALRAFLRQDPDVLMGGGGARFGDRQHRDSGRTNWPFGAVDLAHQRCPQHLGALAQHGHRVLQHCGQREPDYRSAFAALSVPFVQSIGGVAPGRVAPSGCARGLDRCRQRAGFCARGVRALPQRFFGAHGYFSGHAREHRHAATDLARGRTTNFG